MSIVGLQFQPVSFGLVTGASQRTNCDGQDNALLKKSTTSYHYYWHYNYYDSYKRASKRSLTTMLYTSAAQKTTVRAVEEADDWPKPTDGGPNSRCWVWPAPCDACRSRPACDELCYRLELLLLLFVQPRPPFLPPTVDIAKTTKVRPQILSLVVSQTVSQSVPIAVTPASQPPPLRRVWSTRQS